MWSPNEKCGVQMVKCAADSVKTYAFSALGGIVQETGRDGEGYLGGSSIVLRFMDSLSEFDL